MMSTRLLHNFALNFFLFLVDFSKKERLITTELFHPAISITKTKKKTQLMK